MPVAHTDRLGLRTLYEYDGRGNLMRKVEDYTPDPTAGRHV